MRISRGTWLLLAVLLTAHCVLALAPTAWAQRRGRRNRHPGGWDRGWYESGWYDPFWVRLRRGPQYQESQNQQSSRGHSYDRYAAIAYSPSTGKYGYSFGSGSRCCAEQTAMRHCPMEDARIVAWSRNSWCVLALGDEVGKYGWAWATSSGCAKSRALEECRKRTTNCYIAVSVFSGN